MIGLSGLTLTLTTLRSRHYPALESDEDDGELGEVLGTHRKQLLFGHDRNAGQRWLTAGRE